MTVYVGIQCLETWYMYATVLQYIRVSWTLATVTISGGGCPWIPESGIGILMLKVYVALRVRNSGMIIHVLGFVDIVNRDDWWWQVPTDPGWILEVLHVGFSVQKPGMLILGFVDTGNSDDWWPVGAIVGSQRWVSTHNLTHRISFFNHTGHRAGGPLGANLVAQQSRAHDRRCAQRVAERSSIARDVRVSLSVV
jgi:hypothetical protein